MYFLLWMRKADELGINFWLRLLALGLTVSFFLLAFYYFTVINREIPVVPATAFAISEDAERGKTDAFLTIKIRSAIAQTKRLYGLSIAVKNRDGVITLSGEVPTEIDRDLAVNVAKEMPGVRRVNNEIQVSASLKSATEESAPTGNAHVEDLELEANLREALANNVELKAQPIQIKVQQRAVTLTGRVATEAQRQRAEQLTRNMPKVTTVNNQLRLGN